MTQEQLIHADLTWTGRGFESGVVVRVSTDGRIAGLDRKGGVATMRLKNVALLPGFVSAHSHAFQRGLRGLGETVPSGSGSFWTWREAMYRLVDVMDEAKIHALSCQCFSEMLQAGMTTVGEFHYLHHDSSLCGFGLDDAVLRAAEEVGIRIVLLHSYYKTGGIDRPLQGGQRRFGCESVEAYMEQFERLQGLRKSKLQTVGMAPHSIRAVPLDELVSLHEESGRRSVVMHIHVEEQPQEIRDCVDRYGKTPMALINEHLKLNPMFTAVHCTHTAEADMAAYLDAGANVCVCPLTEGNLGDGLNDAAYIARKAGRICIGTDSNSRLCMTEEMRWLEYAQRLKLQRRGVMRDNEGQVGRLLLECATIHGARSLGLKAGRIAEGYCADFVAIDLASPSLRGWTEDSLLDAVVFGTGIEAIVGTCVGGRWVSSGRNGRDSIAFDQG